MRKAKKTVRPTLDQATVVQAALRLLKRLGLEGLTTRSLAAELKVKSPALYWHFRNKQELLDAMADVLIREAGMGPPHPGESWQQWLARRARAYRSSLLAYPDSAQIVAGAKQLSPSTVEIFNEELQALLGFGFDPVQALRTVTALTNYVNGFVFVLQTQGLQQPVAKSRTARTSSIEPASKAKSSLLMVAITEGGSPYSEESFEYGLQALISGFSGTLGSNF
jgi:TetR/AcrR family tetracycline transcriptional repressor